MQRGDKVELSGYELMAVINYVSANSKIVVVHNHSSHILLFRVDNFFLDDMSVMKAEGVYLAAFRYFDEPETDFNKVYGPALRLAVNMAIGEADDAT